MITNLFQSIGVVFTLVIIAVIAVISMYFSYLIGIGIVLITLVFITYHILSVLKNRT